MYSKSLLNFSFFLFIKLHLFFQLLLIIKSKWKNETSLLKKKSPPQKKNIVTIPNYVMFIFNYKFLILWRFWIAIQENFTLIYLLVYFYFFKHPELLVASYNVNEDSPHDPDGVALVWNSKFKKDTPEFIFHCQVNNIYYCNHFVNV